MPSQPFPRRHFLTWDRPWLEQVVPWLAGDWQGGEPLDLTGVIAIVPTRQSGRRLREALANHAHRRGQAVFAPRVLTPEALTGVEGGDEVATRTESLLAWAGVLREIELDAFRQVFPVDPPVRNFAWALQLAFEFHRLQVMLAEGGWLLRDVVERAGEDFVEAERWREIAELGALHREVLQQHGRREPHEARLNGHSGAMWEAAERIVLLAVPDLQPLVVQRLEQAARVRPIDVAIFAPREEAGAFDAWGRPVAEVWRGRQLEIAQFEQRVHLLADPAGQAAKIASLARRYGEAEGRLAIGVADPEITPLLETELRRSGCEVFNPEGRLARSEELFQLLTQLAALVGEPGFGTVEALARCPGFLGFLGARAGRSFSAESWLAELDELRARHLPPDLATARRWAVQSAAFANAARGLDAMTELRGLLHNQAFPEGATETLRQMFATRRLEIARDEDARWHEVANVWMDVVRECAAADAEFGAMPVADGWELALRIFGDRRLNDEKLPGALELNGWLELLWEDAPHLVVAGVNDGSVPESVGESGFVPESLRERLGLDTAAKRFARDAYLLQAIAASRGRSGRLDLVFGKTTTSGEPLRPSRLLLRCPDEQLPERIGQLFRAIEPNHAASAWRRAWKLRPRVAPPPTKVAATALRNYLACPFRFYLRQVLRMQPVDPWKNELDARDFGTLCHAALEKIGLEPALRDCTDAGALRAELTRHLDAAVMARYGRDLALPQLVQAESARQRIAKLAELQAAERQSGWMTMQVERPFEIEIAGLRVRGKIDRIDRHEATGAIRVLDYKTSDTPVSPIDAHLRPVRTGEELPEWACLEFGGREFTWVDLQLPLYLRALEVEFPRVEVCGYLNLPKASGETALAWWEGYTRELHESAMRCAEGACAAIRAGRYWPPNENVPADRDDFASLFHRGVAESVEWPSA